MPLNNNKVRTCKVKGVLHALDMAYIGRDGAIADDRIEVLIRMWPINGRFITAWIAEIPVFFIQLRSYFFNGLHCTYTSKVVIFRFFVDSFQY